MATKFELDAVVKNGTAGNGSGSGHSAMARTDVVLTPDAAAVTLADASVQAIYAELLKRIGEDPDAGWAAADAEADGEVDGVFDQGLSSSRWRVCCMTRCSMWTMTRW